VKRLFRIKHDVCNLNELEFESLSELNERFKNARLGPFGGLYTRCLDWPASVEPLVCKWQFDYKPSLLFHSSLMAQLRLRRTHTGNARIGVRVKGQSKTCASWLKSHCLGAERSVC
jgi:hypothetical protein